MIHNNYTGNRCGVAWKLLLVVSALLLLASCQRTDNVSDTKSTDREMGGDNPVLVKINNENVTQKDIDFTLLKLLGPSGATKADENARKKVLESLVISRVISQEAQKTMSAESRQNIDQQVAAFREELLVKHYLKEHVEPQPITQEMIKNYYEKYPEKYGAKTVREFVMLTTSEKHAGGTGKKLLKTFSEAVAVKNWHAYVKNLSKQGVPVKIKQGNSDEKLLHAQLYKVIKTLKPGETSKPFFVEEKPYVVRVTKENQKSARPLNEVSAEIRQTLLSVQLKTAVRQLSQDLTKLANIEYINK